MKEQCNAGTICLLVAKYEKYEDFDSVYRGVMNLKQKKCFQGLYGNLYIAKGCV